MEKTTQKVLTYSGKKIDPLDPRPEEICIEDIAHALSMICRFGGHCKTFYSVASHSYIGSLFFEDYNLSLKMLFHDASEAYLHDIITPVKGLLTNYKELEEKLMSAICETFNIEWPWSEEDKKAIKRVDNMMLVTEAKSLMKDIDDWEICKYYEPIADLKIRGCKPEVAEKYFLKRFNDLKSLIDNSTIMRS